MHMFQKSSKTTCRLVRKGLILTFILGMGEPGWTTPYTVTQATDAPPPAPTYRTALIDASASTGNTVTFAGTMAGQTTSLISGNIPLSSNIFTIDLSGLAGSTFTVNGILSFINTGNTGGAFTYGGTGTFLSNLLSGTMNVTGSGGNGYGFYNP